MIFQKRTFREINRVDDAVGCMRSNIIDELTFNGIIYSKKRRLYAEDCINNWDLVEKYLNLNKIQYVRKGYLEFTIDNYTYRMRVSCLGYYYQKKNPLGKVVDEDNILNRDIDKFINKLIEKGV